MTELQREAGNRAVAEWVRRSIPVQRDNGAASTTAAAPATPLPDELVDEIVSRTIIAELAKYQAVPIEISGVPTARSAASPAGTEPGPPPPPVTIRINVSATYFINTPTARAHFRQARQDAHFSQIVRSLRGRMSTITNRKGDPLSAGNRIRFGKGTPDDVRAFLQAAVDLGKLTRYARRQGALRRGGVLVDLDPARLERLVQEFALDVGVGVDCSGFMIHAGAEARRNVRTVAGWMNSLSELIGLGARYEVPAEPRTHDRGAADFRSGPRVATPIDLRPGDAWVVSGGGHIRMISAVRRVEIGPGVETLEFDTAESSGTSTSTSPGPVAKTWRTASLARFGRIAPVGGARGNRVGTFHRVP